MYKLKDKLLMLTQAICNKLLMKLSAELRFNYNTML